MNINNGDFLQDEANKEMSQGDELIQLITEQFNDAALDIEFSDTKDPHKPFRTEFAFESLTEKGSRFKRRSAEG